MRRLRACARPLAKVELRACGVREVLALEVRKAGLRLDSFAALQDGSDDGPVLKAGDAAQSPLIQRLLMPTDSDDHMPPAGKPQLSTGEITLLKWWVNAGAPATNALGQLAAPPEVLAALPVR